MKKFSLILTVLALVLGMTQCRKPVIEPTTPVIPGGTVTETITFGTGDDGAKIDFSDLTSPKWQASDKIVVYAYNGTWQRCGELSLTSGEGQTNGTFSGQVGMPADYTKVKFFHYGSDVAFDGTNYTADLADQTNGISSVVVMKTVEIDKKDDGSYTGELAPVVAAMNLNVKAWETGAVAMENAGSSKSTINTTIQVDANGDVSTKPGTGKISYDAASHVILLPPTGATVATVAEFTLKRGNQEAKIRYDEIKVVEGKQLTTADVQYFDYNASGGAGEYVSTTQGSGPTYIEIVPQGGGSTSEEPFKQIPVVKNTTKNVDYYDLQTAIDNATSCDNLQLLSSVILTQPVRTRANTFTLNLGGYSITPDAAFSTTVNDKDALIVVNRGGDLTVTGSGVINSSLKSSVYSAIKVTGKGENDGADAKLTVNSGTLIGNYYAITGNGSRNGTIIDINGGSISGVNGSAIFHPQTGTLNVTNGTLMGGETGIEMRSGTLNMTGGNVISTATEYSCEDNGSGTTTIGAGIAVAKHTTDDNPLAINISGGNVNGYYALNVANPENSAVLPSITVSNGTFIGANKAVSFDANLYTASYDKGILTGGTYNTDPTAYIAAGYKKTGTGPYTVVKDDDDPYVAYIGSTGYETLDAAFAAANAAETATNIVMVNNTTLTSADGVDVNSGKNITLDLAGYTITANFQNTGACSIFHIKNGGNLTVKDTRGDGKAILNSSTVGSWPTPNVATNVFTNEGTLVINGGYFENVGQGYCAYVVDNNSNTGNVSLTVNGGHLVAQYCPIRTYLNRETTTNTVNITDGTFEGRYVAYFQQPSASKSSPLTCTISGGTFIDKTTYSTAAHMFYFGVNNDAALNFSMTGGKYSTSNAEKKFVFVDVENGVTPTCNVSVSGGMFSNNNIVGSSSGNYAVIAEGYEVVANTGSESTTYPWTVQESQGTPVSDQAGLTNAITNAPTDGKETTIKLAADITVTNFVGDLFTIIPGQNIKLDLNGKTLAAAAQDDAMHSVFRVHNGATMTITDSNGNNNGTIQFTFNGTHGSYTQDATIYSSGDLNLLHGSVKNLTQYGNSASYAIEQHPNHWGDIYTDNNPVFHMYDGYVYSNGEEAIRLVNFGINENPNVVAEVVIDAGTVEGWDAVFIQHPNPNYHHLKLTVNGGTLKGSNGAIRVYAPAPTTIEGTPVADYTGSKPMTFSLSANATYTTPNPYTCPTANGSKVVIRNSENVSNPEPIVTWCDGLTLDQQP